METSFVNIEVGDPFPAKVEMLSKLLKPFMGAHQKTIDDIIAIITLSVDHQCRNDLLRVNVMESKLAIFCHIAIIMVIHVYVQINI